MIPSELVVWLSCESGVSPEDSEDETVVVELEDSG